MNIFICGQRSFGKEIVKALYKKGHNIVGVAPPPQTGKYYDKVVGIAMRYDIPVVNDCDRLTSKDIPNNTDLIIAAHSHWFISDKVISKAKYGGIGFHPSLLPRHRGQDAVRWTIAMGDPIAGATVYWLNDKVDGGDIFLQRHIFVDKQWDYKKLWHEIFPIGVDMLCEAVERIGQGNTQGTPQDERYATWEPSFRRDRLKRNELIMIGE